MITICLEYLDAKYQLVLQSYYRNIYSAGKTFCQYPID